METFNKKNPFVVPPNFIQETLTTTFNDDDDHHGPKKKVVKLEGQVDNGGNDTSVETTIMTLGSTIESGQFFQLPLELLPMILTHLAKTNGLPCRQVNSTWKVVMDPILRQGENFKIHFTGQDYSTTRHKIWDLVRLNSCLENCKILFGSLDSFPCVRFILSNLRLEEENVQKFFDLYGPSIQSLELNEVEVLVENGQFKSLNRLLTQQAPNIRDLNLKYPKINSEGIPTVLFNNKQTKLPHLQTLGQRWLETELERPIMKEIVEAAENLKVCNIYFGLENLDQLNVFVSTGKLRIVKNIWMQISHDNIEVWEKFAGLQPTLKSLVVYCTSQDLLLLARAASVINNILQSSKDTLKSLDFFYQHCHIPGLNFPVLKEVRQLVMKCYFGTSFPPGHKQSLSKIFPKVSEVNLSLSGLTLEFWDSLVENNLPSVHTLTICQLENVQDLSRIFPNLKNLVAIVLRTPFVGGIFEHMKELESLELVHFDGSLPDNEYPALDSILTGFSPGTCLRLADSEDMLEEEEIEKLRENLSILELTRLRTLNIRRIESSNSRILSRVSGIWAFQKMPQVKVTVTSRRCGNPAEDLKIQAALNDIAPFVHSVGFE